MLSLVLAESSLELIPSELHKHNSVLAHSEKLGKNPSEILLDNSWHYAAMKGISDEIKRGRPDIVHFSLLEATSIPLYFNQKITVYVHTIDDKVIFIGQDVRLPKSYHRFSGLIEKLYLEKTIKSDSKKLLEIKGMSFTELIESIKPNKVIGLSTKGESSSASGVAKKLTDNSCLVIGGFQKGHFKDKTENTFDELLNIDRGSLESHVVVARVLYEYEKTIFM